MTDKYTDLENAVSKCTDGPWVSGLVKGKALVATPNGVIAPRGNYYKAIEDTKFIALARTQVPELLADLKASTDNCDIRAEAQSLQEVILTLKQNAIKMGFDQQKEISTLTQLLMEGCEEGTTPVLTRIARLEDEVGRLTKIGREGARNSSKYAKRIKELMLRLKDVEKERVYIVRSGMDHDGSINRGVFESCNDAVEFLDDCKEHDKKFPEAPDDSDSQKVWNKFHDDSAKWSMNHLIDSAYPQDWYDIEDRPVVKKQPLTNKEENDGNT